VLDIGCGNGKVGAYLQEAGAVVDGVEPAPDRAMVASRRLRHVARVAAGVESDVAGLDPRYDLVLLLDAIEHVADPAPLLRFAASRLNPEGSIFCLLPNSAHWSFRRKILRGDWRYQDWGLFDRTHLRFFDTRTMSLLPMLAGVIEVRRSYYTGTDHFGWIGRLSTRWPNLFALHALLEWKHLKS
jgi:SAM-dependent methyltransferase